jgi:hypothetical protein
VTQPTKVPASVFVFCGRATKEKGVQFVQNVPAVQIVESLTPFKVPSSKINVQSQLRHPTVRRAPISSFPWIRRRTDQPKAETGIQVRGWGSQLSIRHPPSLFYPNFLSWFPIDDWNVWNGRTIGTSIRLAG